jgi:DNA invertase Pin-like site-specific DNA recombinase
VAGEVVGYARTSTVDQKAGLEDQVAELTGVGCTRVFQEHMSGVDAKRPQLASALDWLREGDTFIVTKPDRLARSTTDLLSIVDQLDRKGVAVRILSMDINTRGPTGKLVLTMLAGIAEFERALMLERQRAGIAKAKAENRYKGRAPTARAKASDVHKLKAEGRTIPEIIAQTGVSRASVYRILAAT